MLTEAVPVSVVKARFSEFVRKAAVGFEVVAANKHGASGPVSIIRTDILTAVLNALEFSIAEETDEELGVLTISVDEIPIYGEGRSREQAVESLVDAALDYARVYEERIELFSHVDSPLTQAHMLKLLRCGGDRAALKQALGV